MNYKKKIQILFLFLVTFVSCSSYTKYTRTDFAMGTLLTVTLFSNSYLNANKILNGSFELADDLEKKVSSTLSDSIISKINNEKTVELNDDFVLETIKEALDIAKNTSGNFDPSLNKLIKLWGFDNEEDNKVPDNDELMNVLSSCGYKNIILDGKNITLKNNVEINLGGIAKGIIIGKIAEYLKNNGVKDFLINGGGDITLKGLYEGKRLWKVAITNPFDKDKFLGVIELTDCSIVTSGDYERNFIGKDGKLYHHLLNPYTGFPADNGVHSVTVISSDPGIADAYATALFIMGKDKGISFSNTISDLDVMFVSGSNNNMKLESTDNIVITKNTDYYEFKYK